MCLCVFCLLRNDGESSRERGENLGRKKNTVYLVLVGFLVGLLDSNIQKERRVAEKRKTKCQSTLEPMLGDVCACLFGAMRVYCSCACSMHVSMCIFSFRSSARPRVTGMKKGAVFLSLVLVISFLLSVRSLLRYPCLSPFLPGPFRWFAIQFLLCALQERMMTGSYFSTLYFVS